MADTLWCLPETAKFSPYYKDGNLFAEVALQHSTVTFTYDMG